VRVLHSHNNPRDLCVAWATFGTRETAFEWRNWTRGRISNCLQIQTTGGPDTKEAAAMVAAASQ